eukprot:691816-Karenia_brevis.AAC.1
MVGNADSDGTEDVEIDLLHLTWSLDTYTACVVTDYTPLIGCSFSCRCRCYEESKKLQEAICIGHLPLTSTTYVHRLECTQLLQM